MISTLNQEQILAELLDKADDWLWETAIAYEGKPHTPLALNEQWQGCGHKQAYIGKYGFYRDGKAYVRVTYHNFKHGGINLRFPYEETYKEIVNKRKSGNSYTPRTINRKVTQEHQIDKATILKLALACDQELWDDGTDNLPYLHSYWEKKGFTENIVDPSVRYCYIAPNRNSAFPEIIVMAKIIGIDGELKGYQKIFPNGDKYLTPAMPKTGNFIILGTDGILPEKLKEIWTVEGLATGATVKQALDNKIPVIATLDAGNIENVVSKLRAKYGSKSKCPITIVADDDKWVALELDPVTNKPKPNAGLTKAHPVALRHRCKIVSPNFTDLDVSSKPTDFNDLMKLVSIDEVKRQLALAKKPDLHIAITEQSLIEEKKRIRQQFFGHNIVPINERYLPNDLPDSENGNIRTIGDFVFSNKVSLFKCPMGTGKTTAIGKLVKQYPHYSIMFITHRISLATDIATRLDIENYINYQGINNDEYAKLHELKELSICVNSLFRLLDEHGKLRRAFDIIATDEITQVIRSLTSMHIKDKVRVISALKQLVQSAKHIIPMDAHIDNPTLELLKEWLPKERFFVLLNEYQVGKNRNIILYDHEGMIGDKALEALKNGQRVFIVTNNKRQASRLYKLFRKVTGKRGLCISSDTGGNAQVKAFFENVNREILNYDFVIASPSVTSGISIDNDVIGFAGGIFTHVVNTPMDALQALCRVRKANTFHVYVSDIKQVLPTTEEEISAKWKYTHKHDETLLSFEDLSNDELIDVAQDYKKICLLVTKEANYSQQDFLSRFIKLCILDGYNITYWDSTPESTEKAKFLQAEATDLENKEFVKDRATSITPTEEEHARLKKKSAKTEEETWQFDKKEILDFYVLDEETPQEIVEQTIIEDRRGKGRKEITNLEIALSSDNQIQQMRKDEAEKGIVLDPDRRAFATEREAYRQILTIAGINTELISTNSRYSAEILLETFVPWVLSNYLVMKGIFKRLPSEKAIKRDPVRVFGTLLKRLGLSQKSIGRNEAGQYCVDPDKLDKSRKIIIKRGQISIITATGKYNVYKNILTTSFPNIN